MGFWRHQGGTRVFSSSIHSGFDTKTLLKSINSKTYKINDELNEFLLLGENTTCTFLKGDVTLMLSK